MDILQCLQSREPQCLLIAGISSHRHSSNYQNKILLVLASLLLMCRYTICQIINPDRTGTFYSKDTIEITLEAYFKGSNLTLDYFDLKSQGGTASIPVLLSKPKTIPFGFDTCKNVQKKSLLSFLVACRSGNSSSIQSGVFWMTYQPLAESNQLTTTSAVILPLGLEIWTYTFEPSCGKLFILGAYPNKTQILFAYSILNPVAPSAVLDITTDIAGFESTKIVTSRNSTVPGMQALVVLVNNSGSLSKQLVGKTYNFTGSAFKNNGILTSNQNVIGLPSDSNIIDYLFSDFTSHAVVQLANNSLAIVNCSPTFNASGSLLVNCAKTPSFVSSIQTFRGKWLILLESFQEEESMQNLTLVAQSGVLVVWSITTTYSPYSIGLKPSSMPIYLTESILYQAPVNATIWPGIQLFTSVSVSANYAATVTFEEAGTGLLRSWQFSLKTNNTVNSIVSRDITTSDGATAFIQPSPYYWDRDLVVVLGASKISTAHLKRGLILAISFANSTNSQTQFWVTYSPPDGSISTQNFNFSVVSDLAGAQFSTNTFLVSENEPFNLEGEITPIKTISSNYKANLLNFSFQEKCVGCDLLYANGTNANFDSIGSVENIILILNLNNNSFLVRYQNSTHALYTCTPRALGSETWNPLTPVPSLDCTLRLSPLSVSCNLLVAGFVISYGPGAKDPIELYLLTATALYTNLMQYTVSNGLIVTRSKNYPVLLSMGDFDYNNTSNTVNILGYGSYQGSVENIQLLSQIVYTGGYGTAIIPTAFQTGIPLPPAFTVDTLRWGTGGYITVSGFTTALSWNQTEVRRYRVIRYRVRSSFDQVTNFETIFESEAVIQDSLVNDETEFKCVIESTLWVVDPNTAILTAVTLDERSAVALRQFDFNQVQVDVSKLVSMTCHDESNTIVLVINGGNQAILLKADPLISPLDRAHSIVPVSANPNLAAQAVGIFYQPEFYAYSPRAIYALYLLPTSFRSTLHILSSPVVSTSAPWPASQGIILKTLEKNVSQSVFYTPQNYTVAGNWIVNSQQNTNNLAANSNLTLQDLVSIEANIGNISICDSTGKPLPTSLASVSQYMIPNTNPPWKYSLPQQSKLTLVKHLGNLILNQGNERLSNQQRRNSLTKGSSVKPRGEVNKLAEKSGLRQEGEPETREQEYIDGWEWRRIGRVAEQGGEPSGLLIRQQGSYLVIYWAGVMNIYWSSQSTPVCSVSVVGVTQLTIFNYYTSIAVAYISGQVPLLGVVFMQDATGGKKQEVPEVEDDVQVSFTKQEFPLPEYLNDITKMWVDSAIGTNSELSVAVGFVYSSSAETDQPYLTTLYCAENQSPFTYLGSIPIGLPEYLATQVLVLNTGVSQFSAIIVYTNSLSQEIVNFQVDRSGITVFNQTWSSILENDADLPGPGFDCIRSVDSSFLITCLFQQSPSKLVAVSFTFSSDLSQLPTSQETYRLTLLPDLQIHKIFAGNSVVSVLGRYKSSSQVLLFYLPSLSVYSLFSWGPILSLPTATFHSLIVLEYTPGKVMIYAENAFPQGVWMDANQAQLILGSDYTEDAILQNGNSLVYNGVTGTPLNTISVGVLFYKEAQQKSKLIWYIILGIILVIVLGAGVAYFKGRTMYTGASGMYQSDVLISQVEGEGFAGQLDSDLRRSGGELLRDAGEEQSSGKRKGAKSFGEA